MRVSESKFSLLYGEALTLKQRMATCVTYNGKMEHLLVNSRKDVLGYGCAFLEAV